MPQLSRTPHPIALAVFDMAGTTVDDHGDVYRALEACVTETGATVAAEDLQRWMGAEKAEAIRALLELGGAQAGDARVEACYQRFRSLLAEYYRARPPVSLPGVEETFRGLRAAGIKVALTTGFAADVTGTLLAGLGWSVTPEGAAPEVVAAVVRDTESVEAAARHVDAVAADRLPHSDGGPGIVLDAVVCASEVARGRPYPYMIFRAMERTGTGSVAEVLVAGDTLVDVQAGAAAGAAHSVGVLTGKLEEAGFFGSPATAVLSSVARVPALLGVDGA